jgi:hypothetical protein
MPYLTEEAATGKPCGLHATTRFWCKDPEGQDLVPSEAGLLVPTEADRMPAEVPFGVHMSEMWAALRHGDTNMTAPRNTPAEQKESKEYQMAADEHEHEPRPPWNASRRQSA